MTTPQASVHVHTHFLYLPDRLILICLPLRHPHARAPLLTLELQFTYRLLLRNLAAGDPGTRARLRTGGQ